MNFCPLSSIYRAAEVLVLIAILACPTFTREGDAGKKLECLDMKTRLLQKRTLINFRPQRLISSVIMHALKKTQNYLVCTIQHRMTFYCAGN